MSLLRLALKRVDADYLGSHLRRFHSRFFVQGARWGDFFAAVEAACPPASLVLDAGAGQGPHRARLPRGCRYLGLDLALGDSAWDYSHLDALADLHDMPLVEEAVDCVLCVQVLEHVHHPHRVVAELARVIRPGGHLFLTTNFMWPQHQKPHDGCRFSSFSLGRLITGAGLQLEWLWPMGGSWSVVQMTLSHALSATLPPAPLRWLLRPILLGALTPASQRSTLDSRLSTVSVEEAIAAHVGDWVLMRVTAFDHYRNPSSGHVIAHAPDDAPLWQKLSDLAAANPHARYYVFSAYPRLHSGQDLARELAQSDAPEDAGDWRDY